MCFGEYFGKLKMNELLSCAFGRKCGNLPNQCVSPPKKKIYAHPADELGPESDCNLFNKTPMRDFTSTYVQKEYRSSKESLSLSPHFTKFKSCAFCQRGLDNDIKEARVAKVGATYFCFCDDKCWGDWLPLYNSPLTASAGSTSGEMSQTTKRIKEQMDLLDGKTSFKLPAAEFSRKKMKKTASFVQRRKEKKTEGKLLEIIQNQLKNKETVL